MIYIYKRSVGFGTLASSARIPAALRPAPRRASFRWCYPGLIYPVGFVSLVLLGWIPLRGLAKTISPSLGIRGGIKRPSRTIAVVERSGKGERYALMYIT
jgi:hypothetical protein